MHPLVVKLENLQFHSMALKASSRLASVHMWPFILNTERTDNIYFQEIRKSEHSEACYEHELHEAVV